MIYVSEATDPDSMSYDPAVAGQPAIPFSTQLRDMSPIRPTLYLRPRPIGHGFFQPAIISDHLLSLGFQ